MHPFIETQKEFLRDVPPFRPGDTVKARCHPLRDGTHGCLLGYLKGPDGSVKNWDGGAVPDLADF